MTGKRLLEICIEQAFPQFTKKEQEDLLQRCVQGLITPPEMMQLFETMDRARSIGKPKKGKGKAG